MLRLALITSLVMIVAPAFSQDKGEIQKLNDQFSAAFNKGDAATLAAMYAEDAVVLPAGSPMVRGRDAIQAFWKQGAEQLGGMQLTTVDIQPLGSEAAREIGTFVLMTKGQSPQTLEGKYVVVWRRIGGAWKLGTDIWNANK